ncbi:hypothetical protein ACFQZ5_14760 [Dactylosporangium darangshiense]
MRWDSEGLHVTVPPGTTAEATPPGGPARVLGPGRHLI